MGDNVANELIARVNVAGPPGTIQLSDGESGLDGSALANVQYGPNYANIYATNFIGAFDGPLILPDPDRGVVFNDGGLSNVANTFFYNADGSVTIDGNLTVTGNTFLEGNVTVIGTENLIIQDPIIEIANASTDGTTMGLVMQRPSGNVMMGYLSTEDSSAYDNTLVFSYTDDSAYNTNLIPRLDPLNVLFTGNVQVGTPSNLLIDVTGSNVLVTSSNVSAGYYHGNAYHLVSLTDAGEGTYGGPVDDSTSNIAVITVDDKGRITSISNLTVNTELSNLEQVVNRGNVTSNTVQFVTAPVAFVTEGRVGIANTSPSHTLSIGSNLYVDDPGANVLVTTGNVSADYYHGNAYHLVSLTDAGEGTYGGPIDDSSSNIAVITVDSTGRITSISNLTVNTELSNLEQVVNRGNVTSNTVQFISAPVAFVTDGGVGIANTSPGHTLSIGSNLYVDDPSANVLVTTGNVSANYYHGNAYHLVSLTDADPGTYGNSIAVPQITVGPTGKITSISNVLIDGVPTSSNLDQVANNGNVTSNTLQFLNAHTAFITDLTSNIGANIEQLHNVTVTDAVTDQILQYNGNEWENQYPQMTFLIARAKNGETIEKGNVVYIVDNYNNNVANVGLADASDPTRMPAVGIAYENFTSSGTHPVVTFGKAQGINTSGFIDGETVYVSNTVTGGLTNVKPIGGIFTANPDLIQNIGFVVKSDVQGVIKVTGVGRSNDIPNANVLPDDSTLQYVYVNTSGNDLKKIEPSKLITSIPTLQQVTDTGNTTTNVVQFQNTTTAFVVTENNAQIKFDSNIIITSNQSRIAIGNGAGNIGQNSQSVAIGTNAGGNAQGPNAIAIGTSAGNQEQKQFSIAIGNQAGVQNQNQLSIAIGQNAGNTDQDFSSIAIGDYAAEVRQQHSAVALGRFAGQNDQGEQSIAIGYNAGTINLGTSAIAIGNNSNALDNSIVLNASGLNLYGSNTNATYIDPIRFTQDFVSNVISYQTDQKEVVNSGMITLDGPGGNVNINGNLVTSGNVYFPGIRYDENPEGNVLIYTSSGEVIDSNTITVKSGSRLVGIEQTNPTSTLHIGSNTFAANTIVNRVGIGTNDPLRFVHIRDTTTAAQSETTLALHRYPEPIETANVNQYSTIISFRNPVFKNSVVTPDESNTFYEASAIQHTMLNSNLDTDGGVKTKLSFFTSESNVLDSHLVIEGSNLFVTSESLSDASSVKYVYVNTSGKNLKKIDPAKLVSGPLTLSVSGTSMFPESNVSFITSGISTDDDKYIGGVLAPNGKIYCAPYSASNVGVIDPSTDTFTTIESSNVSNDSEKYYGGVLAPNGKIYCVPFNASNVGVIDPETDIFSTIPGPSTDGSKYVGGVLASNGKIYCIPTNASNVGVIDPSTDTFTTIESSNVSTDTLKYYGGALAPNGKIYCVPLNAGNVGVIDPETDIFSTISGPSSGGLKYVAGALAPNGKIYCVPFDASNVGVIDPETDTFSTISGPSTDTFKYVGGVLAPSGRIYCVPFNASNVGVIDPVTDTFSTISGPSTDTFKYYGGVLAPNGKIYCVPRKASNVAIIKTGIPTEGPWILQPEFNKL